MRFSSCTPAVWISATIKGGYTAVKTNLIKAAEKMPDDAYSFKATDEVRTFGQIIGHVANANYHYCSAAAGEASPSTVNIEKTKTTKSDLVQALKDSFAYCDKAYDGMTDVSGMQMVKLFGSDTPKLDVLVVNNMHNMEHYGNLVTYMRLKNIVPPTSEPRATPPAKP